MGRPPGLRVMLEHELLEHVEPRRRRVLLEVALVTGPALDDLERTLAVLESLESVELFLELAVELPEHQVELQRAAASSLWEAELLADPQLCALLIDVLGAGE